MAEDGLTPAQILDACATILDNLGNDLAGFLPIVNPLRLNGIRARFIMRLQEDIGENRESYADIPEILELAGELMTALQTDPVSIQELAGRRIGLERRVSVARGYLKEMKGDMCFHVFDHVHFFLEKHGDANLGYDVLLLSGYEAPPKVTAVAMKVTAN
ncbi:hypothetical protein P171DRAFT_487826 [Karstenula rhodostoma CBS 690.94]|uniref:Uncharacterized protein n=1 Tax=Karstenula rhodostoma CBS 690.94 TaxID=1392251 RepID=A0A9P4PGL3_9PLEO|nr:hypothetical protein P171DRAFT_487826 [Karstenula rhodostoma CBS 690.94]